MFAFVSCFVVASRSVGYLSRRARNFCAHFRHSNFQHSLKTV